MINEKIAYWKKLRDRYNYFSSKPITELEEKEIQEFINLRKEIVHESGIKTIFSNIWEQVKEHPEIQAEIRYKNRVEG